MFESIHSTCLLTAEIGQLDPPIHLKHPKQAHQSLQGSGSCGSGRTSALPSVPPFSFHRVSTGTLPSLAPVVLASCSIKPPQISRNSRNRENQQGYPLLSDSASMASLDEAMPPGALERGITDKTSIYLKMSSSILLIEG